MRTKAYIPKTNFLILMVTGFLFLCSTATIAQPSWPKAANKERVQNTTMDISINGKGVAINVRTNMSGEFSFNLPAEFMETRTPLTATFTIKTFDKSKYLPHKTLITCGLTGNLNSTKYMILWFIPDSSTGLNMRMGTNMQTACIPWLIPKFAALFFAVRAQNRGSFAVSGKSDA